MKMTIGEVIEKLKAIDDAIRTVNSHIDHNCYDSLADAAEFLQEYRDMICSIKVDI
jgi:hypothetical protein